MTVRSILLHSIVYRPGGFHHVDILVWFLGYNFSVMDYDSKHIKYILTKKTSFEHYYSFFSNLYQNKKNFESGFHSTSGQMHIGRVCYSELVLTQ